MKFVCLMFIFLSLLSCKKSFQELTIAVAANAENVLREIIKEYQQKNPIRIQLVSGSSGKLTQQIENGAPYHLFLSANMKYPLYLRKKNENIIGPKIYAFGSLVICSFENRLKNDLPTLLSLPSILKIAIANPDKAPYGKAAINVLKGKNLFHQYKHKLIFADSVSKVNHYIATKSVSFGFTSKSSLYIKKFKKDSYFKEFKGINIPQGVIITSFGLKNNSLDALKFYNFLFTPVSQKKLMAFGYNIENKGEKND